MFIGDGRVLPAANQFSLSVTQKSLSSCEIMAYLSVMITSSMVVNAMPRWVRCFVISGFGVGAVVSVSCGAGVSKFTSVNTGALKFGVSSNPGTSSSWMSKSLGKGSASDAVSGAFGCGVVFGLFISM